MSVKNYYPQLPEIPYQKTSIDMGAVVVHAKSMIGTYPKEVVRTAYCEFRMESGNGKDGVNNNYAGIQADCGVWEGLDLTHATGTMVKKDGNGDIRRFICFDEYGYQICFNFLCYKMQERGVYIGAPGINTPEDLAQAYEEKWVANPSENTPGNRADFESLYHSSLTAIA